MKTLPLVITILLMSYASSFAEDDSLVTADELINKLGGESAVEEVKIRTRGIRGSRKIIVKPKEVTIKINFKYDSTELADQRSHLQLAEAGKALSSGALAHIKVEIAGHTDSTGSSQYNLSLSQKRAEKIKNDLRTFYNISSSKLESRGYGEDYPVASNYDAEGRAENRRVVIKRLE